MKRLTRVGGLMLGLALCNLFPLSAFSDPPQMSVPPLATGRQEGIRIRDNGTIELRANAPPAPKVYGSFEHFGIFISPTHYFSKSLRSLTVSYDASVPSGTAFFVDIRSSTDGQRWSSWELGLANGASATFAAAGRFAQYRVTLLGHAQARPSLRSVRLSPSRVPRIAFALADEQTPVAPTYRIYATRLGMVGGRTANGHRITKRDHFVALPSRRSLSSNGGREYMVRITYNGRSTVAPVYDVGPWNIHDNYWDEHRERFNDLPRGWPQHHAAYFDK
jgi:hypothetical protein